MSLRNSVKNNMGEDKNINKDKPQWFFQITSKPRNRYDFGFWVGIVPEMGGDLVFNVRLYYVHFGYAW